jgi:predicted kinase
MTLVVVSGAPGTGKSTVAAALAARLGWPLLSLDPVKAALAGVLGTGDVLGTGAEDWSNRLGDAAAEVVFRQAAWFPDAVAEGWWRGPRRERAVREFAGAAEVGPTVTPLGLGAALVDVDTGRPGAPGRAAGAVAAALNR